MIIPESNAFLHFLKFPLGKRTMKPRAQGITMVIDKGLGYQALQDLLDVSAPYIDLLKFGFGTGCLYPTHILKQKLALARLYSVHTCPGGTLGEIAILQNCYQEYVETCKKLGFTAMEVSDGTIQMDVGTRQSAIQTARQYMDLVITEVGKKNGEDMVPHTIAEQILSDISTGADFVIVEGRESGENVGIYGESGTVKNDVLQQMMDLLPKHVWHRLVWEAPKKSQQVEMIRRFGTDVNLGNIVPSEAISVECLRLGLRGDTLLGFNTRP